MSSVTGIMPIVRRLRLAVLNRAKPCFIMLSTAGGLWAVGSGSLDR